MFDFSQSFYIVCIFIGSFLIHCYFCFARPYFNIKFSKFILTLSSLNFWTAIMIVFAKVLAKNLKKKINYLIVFLRF